MFNKNINNDNKKITIKYNNFYKLDDILLTPSFVIMLNMYNDNKVLLEKMDYQDRITSYINRKHENSIRKEYNPKITNLYNNGIIIINNIEYKLKDFYIVFMDTNNDFHLKCVDEKFNNDNYEYNKAVKFIDSTAFINLINNENTTIHDNKLIINDKNILIDTIHNWDGYLHSETNETDSILNKKMIRDENNE